MRVKKHPAMLHYLMGNFRSICLIRQHHPRRYPKWHNAVLHFKPGNKQLPIMKPAPLGVEIRKPIDAVIA
jgi:hypothetical protein